MMTTAPVTGVARRCRVVALGGRGA